MPDDDTDKDKFDLSKDPNFIEMQKMIRGLGVIVAQGQKSTTSLKDSVESLVAQMKSDPKERKSKDDDAVDEDAINDLDNKSLVKIVLSEVGKLIKQQGDDTGKKVDTLNQSFASERVKARFKELQGEHKDVNDWLSEMQALGERHPTLDLEDLYDMAKKRNPDKAKDLIKKYSSDDDNEKSANRYIGLFSTAGTGSSDDGEKLTQQQAGDKAWNDVLEQFPQLASGDG